MLKRNELLTAATASALSFVVVFGCQSVANNVLDLQGELPDTEAIAYDYIQLTPNDFACLSQRAINDIHAHNLIYGCRNPETQPDNFPKEICYE